MRNVKVLTSGIWKTTTSFRRLNKTTLQGFYQEQRYAFNPQHDPYQEGYDWTEDLDTSTFKVPIPQEMFLALDGIVLDVPSWEEGIPEDLQPAMDRLADLVDE